MSSIEKIFDLINQRGITAYRMAKDLGFPTSLISAWKSGRANPSAEALIKIADYFDVPTDYLLNRGLYQKAELINEYFDYIYDSIKNIQLTFKTKTPQNTLFLEKWNLMIEYLPEMPLCNKIQYLSLLIKDIEVENNHINIHWNINL